MKRYESIEKNFITLLPRKKEDGVLFFEIVLHDTWFCVQNIKHYM